MKFYFLVLSLFFISTIYSQGELSIDYDAIKDKISNPDSLSYYPNLLKRYEEFDETLTIEEMILIYYGFSFQENYIKNCPSELYLDNLLESEDYENIVTSCKEILVLNPVSLKANNMMGYALFKLGKQEAEWKKYQKRYRDFRKIIAYSGNGLNCETAFKVICVSDEYNMMYDYFDVISIGRQELEGLCDKFEIKPSKYFNAKVIYFDISRALIRHQEILDERK